MALFAGTLLGLALFGCVIAVLGLFAVRWLRQRKVTTPVQWPGISILKPLAGLDDGLEQNLLSHLAIDYPGEWELLLGVRSPQDGAYETARAFAAAHGPRVKLVVQEGEPGFNPKVNQLITLTAAARFPILAGTDSNIRVHPQLLKEHASLLAPVQVGLSSHVFVGSGEETLWAAFDNMVLCSFVATNLAFGLRLKKPQIVGKSYAIKRKALEAAGGWDAVKDLLAEDQRVGMRLTQAGYTLELGPTPVLNIQQKTSLGTFFRRHSRWAMIRSRILVPEVYLEPILNPLVMSLFALAVLPSTMTAVGVLAMALFSIIYTQTCAVAGRGQRFAWKYALLIPLRDVIFFAIWLRGITMRQVAWRSNRFVVGKETRLEPIA